jgi:hypothetical protein
MIMSNNDHKLIWEAYNYDKDFKLLLKIQKEWDDVILPQLSDADAASNEFDSKYDNDGNFLILTPLVHLVYEQEIDPDMELQEERIEQDFRSFFSKYDFITFSAKIQEDYKADDFDAWIGINVQIQELTVPADMIHEYFKIVLAVNNKAKELSKN